jgi:hypothetical protein
MSLKFIAALLYFSAPERWNGATALDRDDQLIVKTRACTRAQRLREWRQRWFVIHGLRNLQAVSLSLWES